MFRDTTANLGLDGFLQSLISAPMLITIILKIEKLIIINKKMKLKTLFEKSITPIVELIVIELYMRILFIKDTISAV